MTWFGTSSTAGCFSDLCFWDFAHAGQAAAAGDGNGEEEQQEDVEQQLLQEEQAHSQAAPQQGIAQQEQQQRGEGDQWSLSPGIMLGHEGELPAANNIPGIRRGKEEASSPAGGAGLHGQENRRESQGSFRLPPFPASVPARAGASAAARSSSSLGLGEDEEAQGLLPHPVDQEGSSSCSAGEADAHTCSMALSVHLMRVHVCSLPHYSLQAFNHILLCCMGLTQQLICMHLVRSTGEPLTKT